MDQAVSLRVYNVATDPDDLLTRAEAVLGEYGPAVIEGTRRDYRGEQPMLTLRILVPATSALAAINDKIVGGLARILIGLGIEDAEHDLRIEPER